MDLEAFSSENFSVKDWINNAFSEPEAKENKDAYASSLVMKLQLYIWEINHALEETGSQVLASLPRVARDVVSLQSETAELMEQMKLIEKDVSQVEKDTRQSVETIMKLDSIKCRFADTTQALQEADKWTTLFSDLEEVFENSDIESIAKKLDALMQSLSLLTHVPDYQERCQTLEGLKNRLEALSSPHIVAAFNSNSQEKARFYRNIFDKMGRLPQYLKYFHNCHKVSMLQKWKHIVESDQEDTALEWILYYYDYLSQQWFTLWKWCGGVLPMEGRADLLCGLYSDVLVSLDPDLSFCISAGLKQQDDPLTYLLKIKTTADRFASHLKEALGKDVVHRNAVQLCSAIYGCFTTYQSKYQKYEELWLLGQLQQATDPREDVYECIQGLDRTMGRLCTAVIESCKRIITFTNGCGFDAFQITLTRVYEKFFEDLRLVLRRLETHKSSSDDWLLFQQALHLLHGAGELLMQSKELDQAILSQFSAALRGYTFDQKSGDPFAQVFPFVFLNGGELSSLKAVCQSLQSERVSMLSAIDSQLKSICLDIQGVAFDTIFSPICSQLEQVPHLDSWLALTVSVADTPSFSYPPQEYITQVGQYLMTLPQHLEMVLQEDSPVLRYFLRSCPPPYLQPGESGSAGHLLLLSVAEGVSQLYVNNILKIREVRGDAAKQLAADIVYFGDVLEDLGVRLTNDLKSIKELLILQEKDFSSSSSGYPPQIAKAVKKMRMIYDRSSTRPVP